MPEDKWTSWRLHTTEHGETLSDIAKHYRVTVAAIEAANHLEPHAVVPAGFLLDVPTAPPVQVSKGAAAPVGMTIREIPNAGFGAAPRTVSPIRLAVPA